MQELEFILKSYDVWFLMGVHVIVSLCVSIIAYFFLKKKYQEKSALIFVLFLIFNLVFPVLGLLLSIWLSILLSVVKEKQYLHNVEKFSKEELYTNSFPVVNRIFGEGALIKLTHKSLTHSENRMKALVFMAENLTKQNISLIKNLLSDKDNEIRLYSYSLINNMERDINENIEQKKKQLLKEVSFEKRSLLLSELATLYWEMVYYGISDGETKSFMYDKVKYYANEAMQSIKYRGPLSLLLAKVNFAEKNYSKALALFIDAIQKGMDKNTINPYLAEISFELKDFKSVKQSMQDVNQHEVSMLIDPIAQEWRTS
jgi:hypothetical protein